MLLISYLQDYYCSTRCKYFDNFVLHYKMINLSQQLPGVLMWDLLYVIFTTLFTAFFLRIQKCPKLLFEKQEIFFVIFWDKGKKLCYFSTIDYHELGTFTVNSFFLSKDLKDQLIKFSLQSIPISLQIDIN